MAITETGESAFQPYARLISILGDQLISDKWVGVIELVKNCYDADAESVKVKFEDFSDNEQTIPQTIIIEDNGLGMDLDTILNVWMKPATPNKLNQKKDQRFTPKGRVMQGDKGVGRFAIYKLGDMIEVYTKTKTTNEIRLTLDFKSYADDTFAQSNHQDRYLSDIKNKYEIDDVAAKVINPKNQGTTIVIKALRNAWKKDDLDKLLKAFYRMMPPQLPGINSPKDFDVRVYWGGLEEKFRQKSFDEILGLAPFYFEGFIETDGTLDFTYKHGQKEGTKRFNIFTDEKEIAEYDIWNLKLFRETFLDQIDKTSKAVKNNLKVVKIPQIGHFMFFFYAYDWRNPLEGIKEDEKKFLQENSVFLYRDNVRVFPYGERGVDWLNLSKGRAEDRAGSYFSYNDLIGFIFITQNENSVLRDAADREGLMNINGSYEEFISLIQATLKVMKDEVDIDKGKTQLKKQTAVKSFNKSYEDSYQKLQNQLLKLDDKELIDSSKRFFSDTNNLIQKVREDLKITQELAGTGMAVEKATHDTMSLLKRLKTNTEDIVKKVETDQISPVAFRDFLIELHENLEFLYQELQVLQPLFRVARKVTKDVSVQNVADRVMKYFRKELVDKIKVTIKGNDVVVRTNTGLILQVLLNLMDNAVYWLDQVTSKNKQIQITLDAEESTVIFSDNGVGIDPEIKDLIFSEFYSKKSDGRGLGLYIVKELLERIDADIEVIVDPADKILDGANFKITFKPQT